MKNQHKKLSLGRETLRQLGGVSLRIAVGGSSGPIDQCLPASPYNTCTGCTIGSQEPCGTGWCGPGGGSGYECGGSFGCTLVENTKDGGR